MVVINGETWGRTEEKGWVCGGESVLITAVNVLRLKQSQTQLLWRWRDGDNRLVASEHWDGHWLWADGGAVLVGGWTKINLRLWYVDVDSQTPTQGHNAQSSSKGVARQLSPSHIIKPSICPEAVKEQWMSYTRPVIWQTEGKVTLGMVPCNSIILISSPNRCADRLTYHRQSWGMMQPSLLAGRQWMNRLTIT